MWGSPDLASVCSVNPMADGSIAIAPSGLAKSTLQHASVAEAQVVRAVLKLRVQGRRLPGGIC